MRRLAAPLGALLLAAAANAAVEVPQPSPGATVSEKVGTANLTITYHRPGVKGRDVWGGLVPFGEVWRMGANDATTLELSHDGKVAGKPLPAGKYALFALPGKETWRILVNSQADQWGAYFRDPKKDVLAFDVTPEAGPHQEWLEFRVFPETRERVRVEMAWEKLRVAFPVEFDVSGIVWKAFDAALAAEKDAGWTAHFQAAKYAFQSGERREKATEWLDLAMSRGQSFWMDELKGDLLAGEGKYAEAVPHLERAIEASKKAGAPEAWRDGARKKLEGWKAKAASPGKPS